MRLMPLSSRLLALFVLCAPVHAGAEIPPALLWSRTWANPALDGDHLWDMAQGGCNRVAVVGTAHWPAASAQGEVRMYDGGGALVWSNLFPVVAGGSEGLGVAIDSGGNAVASGFFAGDWIVRRYDPVGTLLWSRTYTPAVNAGNEGAVYLSTDPNTNEVVVAGSEVVGSYYNWAVRKLNPVNGNEVWAFRYDGPNGTQDQCNSAAVDGTGAVYIAGYEETATQGRNVRVMKLSSAGATVWSTTYNGPGNGEDSATKMILMPGGNLLLTGIATNASANHDILTMVVNAANGAIVWSRLYNGQSASTDRGYNVGADSNNNTYSSGWQSTPAGAGWVVIKYDAGGNLLWTLTYAGYAAGLNEALGMTVDTCDYLYVSGHEQGPTGLRWMVRKYDLPPPPPPPPPAATILNWSRTYTSGSGVNLPYAAKVDGCGNLAVAGWENVGGQADWLVRQYGSDGSLRWEARYAGAAGLSDQAQAVAADGTGAVIVGGVESVSGQGSNWLLRKYSALGSLVWSAGYNGLSNSTDSLWGIATDGAGNIYAAGSELRTDIGEGPNWLVRKYNAGGNLVWSRTYRGVAGANYNDEAYGCAADAAGNVVVVGYEMPNATLGQMRIMKYDPAGTLLWSRTYAIPPSNSDERANRVTLGPNGEIYVAGTELPTAWPNYDWKILAFDAAGNNLWSANYPGSAEDRAQAVTVLADGTVVVGGMETVGGASRNWLIQGYSPAGALLWTLTYGGAALGSDECYAVSADTNGNWYAVGAEALGGGHSRWVVRRYGAVTVPACSFAPVIPPPPPPPTTVKLVGGVRGYINPKNGEQATILVKDAAPGEIKVRIYDRLGRLVREITALATGSGAIVLKWNATDASSQPVPAGIYPIIVEAPGFTYQDKLAVLR